MGSDVERCGRNGGGHRATIGSVTNFPGDASASHRAGDNLRFKCEAAATAAFFSYFSLSRTFAALLAC